MDIDKVKELLNNRKSFYLFKRNNKKYMVGYFRDDIILYQLKRKKNIYGEYFVEYNIKYSNSNIDKFVDYLIDLIKNEELKIKS